MTKLRLSLIMLALTVRVSAADISGMWDMDLKADWTTIPALVCTLSQSGQQLVGSCRPPGAANRDAAELTGGTVEGDLVTCQWRIVTPDGQAWTYALRGTLDAKATRIEGSFTLSSAETNRGGTFTAKRQ
jgi:hypothetical protein